MSSLEFLSNNPILSKGIYSVLLVIIISILVGLSKKALNKVIVSTDNKYKARKAVNFIGYFLMVLGLVFVFGEKLGNFGVIIGVTGAGIAFALQEVILSIAGWVFILFSKRVVVGQRIKVGELKGDIIDVGVLSTTFMEIGDWVKGDLYNGRIVSLANNFVFKEKIQNYSSEYPFLWDEIQIPIKHGGDFTIARELFLSALNEICGEYATLSMSKWKGMTNRFNVENADVNPMVTMSFDQNWITFNLRYIVDYKKRRSTSDRIYSRILKEIEHSEKIEVATSAMEVTIPQSTID